MLLWFVIAYTLLDWSFDIISYVGIIIIVVVVIIIQILCKCSWAELCLLLLKFNGSGDNVDRRIAVEVTS